MARIDFGTLLLLTHPDQCDAIRRDPELVVGAVEEIPRDPDRFDITRTPNPHLSFGYGPRFCVGAGLARVNLHAVFTALPRRLPALELAVPLEDLQLRTDVLIGGLTALPVTW